MTELTKKSEKFMWNSKYEESFYELKKRLTRATVLVLSKEKNSFVIYTDASKEGLGCVLLQNEKGDCIYF